jgi:superfamily II DNA or RNA helicase
MSSTSLIAPIKSKLDLINNKRELLLRDYQIEAHDFALQRDISLLAMCPGAGKTETSIGIIRTFLELNKNKNYRVLVLAHSRNEIKDNFMNRLIGLNLNFTYSDNLSDNSQVHICLPQNIDKIKGRYHLLIVDEAHENYLNSTTNSNDSKEYQVQQIITKIKPIKQVLLSGSPSKFIYEGWNELDRIYFKAIGEIPSDFYSKVQIELVAINAKWKSHYNANNNIKESYKHPKKDVENSMDIILASLVERLKTKSAAKNFNTQNWLHFVNKLKSNILFEKLGKTIFYASNVNHANKIYDSLIKLNINCTLSHSENDVSGQNVRDFHDNKYIVLVCVRRATLAYSDDNLYNVVDMSGTHNINLIYQTMSRIVRGNQSMEKFYLKVTTTEIGQMELTTAYVGAALLLTHRDYFSTFNGKNFSAFTVVIKDDAKKSSSKPQLGSGSTKNKSDNKKDKVRIEFPSFADADDCIKLFNDLVHDLNNPTSIYKTTSIAEVKEILNDNWDDNYNLLVDYINENWALPIAKEIYNDVNIGNWVSMQRDNYKQNKLSNEQIEKLESLLDWSWNPHNDAWNDNYNLLKDFIEINNHLPKTDEIYKDIKIGSWLHIQRQNIKQCKLSQDRAELIKSVKYFTMCERDDTWNSTFNLLNEYVDLYNKLPKHNEIYKNINIGDWITTQRVKYKNNKLSQDRIKKIESLEDWIWFTDYDNIWNTNYNSLKKYVETYNKIPVQKCVYNNIKIGIWVFKQKQKYKKNNLSNEQVQKLESLNNWVWNIDFDSIWNDKFNLLKEYIGLYNKIPKQIEIYEGIKIGNWINDQKNIYKKGTLPQDRIELLESLEGWTW